MINILLFAWIIYAVQIIHSLEELSTGFHKKWFVFKMPFRTFLAFEIIHNSFWAIVLIYKSFPFRLELLAFFIVLMFAQSLWHLAWWAMKKEYVPGLVTAIIHVILFLVFYFQYVRI